MPADATAPQPLTPANMPPVGRRWRHTPDAVQGSKTGPPATPTPDLIAAAERRLGEDLSTRKTRLGW